MKRPLKYIDQYIVKSGSHLPRKLFVLCFNEGPLKMIKYVFNFMLKALFALKLFIVVSYLFVYVKKRIVKKICNVTAWAMNNYNTYTVQYIKK